MKTCAARVPISVDPAVGIVIRAHVGEKVNKGEALAEPHLREHADIDAFSSRARSAWSTGEASALPPLVLDRIRR